MNTFEKGPRIPTREEILEIISRHAENSTLVRELSDDNGVYLLETKAEGANLGESVHYEYRREGVFPNHNESLETVIYRVDYKNEIPVWGVNIETFDATTGAWKKVE